MPKQATSLAGYWSETDAKQVSQALIARALSDPWLVQFEDLHGGKQPTVSVGTVSNLSPEHISIPAFIVDMQRALIDSGKVRFMPSRIHDNVEETLFLDNGATRDLSDPNASADFTLQGNIAMTLDGAAGGKTKWYEIDMRVIDLHDGVVVWVGQQRIKKTAGAESHSLQP
jgi:hypothetical protein